MGKRKRRDKAEREERELRRIARANASRMRHMLLDAGVKPEDLVSLDAEGYVGKHAHVTGTPTPEIDLVTFACKRDDHPYCGMYVWPDGQNGDPKRCACWCHNNPTSNNSVTPPSQNEEHDSTTTTG